MAHPYKSVELAFMEILNYHSHTEKDIVVNIKESTDNYVGFNLNYIVNISSVSLDSYSSVNTANPDNANIYFVNEYQFSSKINRIISNLDDDKSLFVMMNDTSVSVQDILDLSKIDDQEEATGKF